MTLDFVNSEMAEKANETGYYDGYGTGFAVGYAVGIAALLSRCENLIESKEIIELLHRYADDLRHEIAEELRVEIADEELPQIFGAMGSSRYE